jgi:hypothetical protein
MVKHCIAVCCCSYVRFQDCLSSSVNSERPCQIRCSCLPKHSAVCCYHAIAMRITHCTSVRFCTWILHSNAHDNTWLLLLPPAVCRLPLQQLKQTACMQANKRSGSLPKDVVAGAMAPVLAIATCSCSCPEVRPHFKFEGTSERRQMIPAPYNEDMAEQQVQMSDKRLLNLHGVWCVKLWCHWNQLR